MPVPDTPWTWSKALCHSSPSADTQWTRSRAFADLVQPLFGRGAILPLGPGPTTMPHRHLRATLGGPGPPHKITPRPNIGHTKAKNQPHLGQIPPGPGQRLYAIQVRCKYVGLYTVDLVQPPCPTSTPEPHSVDLVHHTKLHLGQISATPRPKHSHTSAKHPLDLVQGLRGPGPPPIK